MKKVVVIVGPTASGKTRLSIELAKKFHAEIINGDSVQVYQRLDIGSAKIKEEEKESIPHHLFDVCNPKKSYTVYHFQTDVRQKIDQIERPFIVGGTGLYIKAALYDYEFDPEPPHNEDDPLLTNEEIYEKLIKIDPDINIDPNNRRRLIRALALAKSGHLRSKKTKKDHLLYDALIIYLDINRSILEERLNKRLDQQLNEGFIEEVKSLRADDIHINAIGYREIDQYLNQALTYEDMKAQIIKKSKQLAKKQKTWFKNQMDVVMLDALDPKVIQKATKLVEEFLKDKE